MNTILTPSVQRLLLSWLRVFAAAALTAYLVDPTVFNVRDILLAGVVALGPVILRWLNPNDPAYGRGSEGHEVAQAITAGGLVNLLTELLDNLQPQGEIVVEDDSVEDDSVEF